MKKHNFILYGASSDLCVSFIQLITKDKQYVASNFFCVTRKVKKLKKILDEDNTYFFREQEFLSYLNGNQIKNATIILFSGKVFYDSFQDISRKDIYTIFNINVFKPVLFLAACMSHLKSIKQIVYIGSQAGLRVGHKYFSLYAASKQSLGGLFNCLENEYPNIDFKIFNPRGFESKISEQAISSKDFKKKFESSVLLKTKHVARELIHIIENEK